MEDTRQLWNKAFLEAAEFDVWGQVEEAVACYQRLQLAAATEAVENVLQLPSNRRAAISHLAIILKLRVQELAGAGRAPGRLGTAGIQALKPFVSGLIVSDVPFPAQLVPLLREATAAAAAGAALQGGIPAADDEAPAASATISTSGRSSNSSTSGSSASGVLKALHGSSLAPKLQQAVAGAMGSKGGLTRSAAGASSSAPGRPDMMRPPPEAGPGEATLHITITSWSLKAAAALEGPRIVMTVRSPAGKLLEAVQESPPAAAVAVGAAAAGVGDVLTWPGLTFHLQTPLSSLPGNATVFFELVHYKAAKKRDSTKGYSCLELEELPQQGSAASSGAAMALEVYKKENLGRSRRGRPVLLSSKPLFLHIRTTIQRH